MVDQSAGETDKDSGAPRDVQAKSVVRVGVAQFQIGSDVETNKARVSELVKQAAAEEVKLLCLPELFPHPYFCQRQNPREFGRAEPIPGPTCEFLCKLARDNRVALITSLFEQAAPGFYFNTAVVISADGRLVGKYRKVHIPHDPYYFEKYYFCPGDLGFPVFDVEGLRLGVLVCWDQWFPEAVRALGVSGCSLVCIPTAMGWIPGQDSEEKQRELDAWVTVHRAHAITNGLFVCVANRVGQDGELYFWGNSLICEPDGGLLVCLDSESTQIAFTDCNLTSITSFRHDWPFWRDRRPETYWPLMRKLLERAS